MTRRIRSTLLAVASLALGSYTQAGLLDSPPPAFGDLPGQVVFRMGPVYYHPGEADTIVTCTNADDVPARVALELFDQADQPVGTLVQAALAVRGTVNFVTSANSTRDYWVVIENLSALDHGKARVSATTTRLSCTAYHRIRASDGTIQEKALELVKKVPHRPRR